MSLIKTKEEIEKIRAAGKILAKVAKVILATAKEGVTLLSLDKLAEKLIKESGAKPAFLGYRPYGAKAPYPCSICASVNEVVVHGVPNDYALRSGDVLKLDFGVNLDGWNADAAWTKSIGNTNERFQKMIKTTETALFDGIKQAKAGKTLGDIGWAISERVKKGGFAVVEGLTGHGIGRDIHEDPSVYNVGQKGKGMTLKPGMVLAIEPMVSAGSPRIIQKKDDSFAIEDGSSSAHFEHTVAITDSEPEILTLI